MRVFNFYADVVPTHLTKILVTDLSPEHSEKGNYQPRVGFTSKLLLKEEGLHTSIP